MSKNLPPLADRLHRWVVAVHMPVSVTTGPGGLAIMPAGFPDPGDAIQQEPFCARCKLSFTDTLAPDAPRWCGDDGTWGEAEDEAAALLRTYDEEENEEEDESEAGRARLAVLLLVVLMTLGVGRGLVAGGSGGDHAPLGSPVAGQLCQVVPESEAC